MKSLFLALVVFASSQCVVFGQLETIRLRITGTQCQANATSITGNQTINDGTTNALFASASAQVASGLNTADGLFVAEQITGVVNDVETGLNTTAAGIVTTASKTQAATARGNTNTNVSAEVLAPVYHQNGTMIATGNLRIQTQGAVMANNTILRNGVAVAQFQRNGNFGMYFYTDIVNGAEVVTWGWGNPAFVTTRFFVRTGDIVATANNGMADQTSQPISNNMSFYTSEEDLVVELY